MIISSEIQSFISSNKIEVSSIEKITLAGNNQIYKLKSPSGNYALKQYYLDDHMRFEREINFLNLLTKNHIDNVPKIVALDKKNNTSLMSWIDGMRILNPTTDDVISAANFIKTINKTPIQNGALILPAVDSGFSYADHYKNVGNRISSLKKILSNSSLDKEFHNAILDITCAFNQLPTNNLYIDVQPILSPSDFGFHNALRKNNFLYFLDFEYSGWDDPIKLCCDFFLQPKIGVDFKYVDAYIDTTISVSGLSKKEFIDRVKILYPLCIIKWACITMNIINPKLLDKRALSSGLSKSEIVSNQLVQTKKFLEMFNCLK